MKKVIKPLCQDDFPNRIIKDLGMINFPLPNSKLRRVGIFECEHCNINITARAERFKFKDIGLCKSCMSKKINTTHGYTKTRLYNIWRCMKQRCYYPLSESFKNYGGIGVTVCDEWRNDFYSFKKWALNNGYEDGLSIDKDILCHKLNISPKIYSPNTCIWTTRDIQSQSTRRIHSDNTSGYRGVCYDKSKKRWMSSIMVKNKSIFIGRYKCVLQGAYSYDKYVRDNNLSHTKNFKD